MKKLIITGTSRTGTTGLTYYLNQDPDVLVLQESGFYCSKKSKIKKLEFNDFFRQQLELKHIDFHRIMCAYPNHMNDEFSSFKVFGDKYPHYINVQDTIPHDIIKIFCIRDPRSCVLSKMEYFKMDMHDAIKEYNQECSLIPDNAFVVKYEDAVTNINQLHNNLEIWLDIKLNIDNNIYKPININRHTQYPTLSKQIWEATSLVREKFGYTQQEDHQCE